MAERQTCQELPFDIVYKILLSLPVKSLGRFRCVCKTWFSLISHSRFQKDHYHLSKQTPLLLVMRYNFYQVLNTNTLRISTNNNDCDFVKTFPKTDGQQNLYNGLVTKQSSMGLVYLDDVYSDTIRICDPSAGLHISTNNNDGNFVKTFSITHRDINQYTALYTDQSCLGLVCLEDNSEDSRIMICNPSTEELITQPQPPGRPMYRQWVGFGYAASTKEFKVVCFSDYWHVFTFGASDWREAFNGEIKDWREVWTTDQQYPTILYGCDHFLHGALHLLTCKDGFSPWNNYKGAWSLVAFDMETEEYRGIPLPKYYSNNYEDIFHLTELRGSLCLAGKPTVHVELWLLKDYNSNEVWVKEYTIAISLLSSVPFNFRVLAMVGDGSIWFSIFSDSYSHYKLVCYNPQSRSVIREIKTPGYCQAISYTETFLSFERRIRVNKWNP